MMLISRRIFESGSLDMMSVAESSLSIHSAWEAGSKETINTPNLKVSQYI